MKASRRRPALDEDDVQPVSRTRPEYEGSPRVSEAVAVEEPPGRAAPDRAAPDGAAPDGAAPDGAAPDGAAPKKLKKPLYPRLLRLRHIEPNAWQRAALGEGAVGAGVLLAMADLATAWSILALPVAVAVIVKAHDALQGLLDRGAGPGAPVA